METTTKKERKIGNAQAAMMITVAIMIDLLQFVFGLLLIGVILNYFISFMAFLIFWFWFILNGISFTRSMKEFRIGITFFGTAFGEIAPIPFLNVLPIWTLGIIAVMAMTRVKEIV